jgi:hypothetical protein
VVSILFNTAWLTDLQTGRSEQDQFNAMQTISEKAVAKGMQPLFQHIIQDLLIAEGDDGERSHLVEYGKFTPKI